MEGHRASRLSAPITKMEGHRASRLSAPITKMEGREASEEGLRAQGSRRWRDAGRQGSVRWRGPAEGRGGLWLERDIVGAVAGHEGVGEGGAIDLDGVVHLTDGVEDMVCGADAERRAGLCRLFRGRQEIGVLGEEDLDEEEEGGVDEVEGFVDGDGDVRGAEHGSPRGAQRLRL